VNISEGSKYPRFGNPALAGLQKPIQWTGRAFLPIREKNERDHGIKEERFRKAETIDRFVMQIQREGQSTKKKLFSRFLKISRRITL
jgi:hypothetical protein